METEREFTFSEAEYNELVEAQKAERMKSLRRHKLPEKLTLREALNGMTKQELEDIQYNLNLPMAKNIDRVKKAEMLDMVEPEVVKFAGRWFVSALQEQKELFDYACQHKGLLENVHCEDYRLDYLRGIGVLSCGMQDGNLVWFMPEEIQAEYQKISNGAFDDAVNLNSEVMRLAAGMVFYYGIINYDELYKKICDYIDADLEFADFMGIIFNGGCWYPHVVTGQHDLMHESLMNPEALQQAQRQQGSLDYANDIGRSVSQIIQFMQAHQIEYPLEAVCLAGIDPYAFPLYREAIYAQGASAPVEIFNDVSIVTSSNIDVQNTLRGASGLIQFGKNTNFLNSYSDSKKHRKKL